MKNGIITSLTASLSALLISGCNPPPPPSAKVETPQQIKTSIRESTAPLTLVHVWATWCDPCREEFPALLKAFQEAKADGLALLLVSADDPGDMDAVERFLVEQQSPVGSLISSELNQDFIALFSANWAGALPASFFFDTDGRLLAEWQGKRSYEEYVATIEALLKKGKE